ncbi:MAG: glycosyltransferase family 9 protein [Bacteroidota bacterium]
MKRTVVLKLGGLGDMLMLGPSLQSFADSFPGTELILITGSSNSRVLNAHPAISRQYLLNDARLFRGGILGKLSQTFRLWWLLLTLRPSEVFILHRDWRYNLMAFLAFVPVRYGFSRDLKGAFLTAYLPNDQSLHETEKYSALFSLKPGFKPGSLQMRMYPTAAEREQVNAFAGTRLPAGKKLVAIAAGGALNAKMSSENKRWAPANYATLAANLMDDDYFPVFVGGPGDKEMVSQLISGLPDAYRKPGRYADATGLFSPSQTYALLQHCHLMVSNDCGPMHIGSASGIPVIALFGPTDPAEYRPVQNPLSYTFWPGGEQLPCSPCYFHGYFPPCSHVSCMKMILPTQVFAKVKEILTPLN